MHYLCTLWNYLLLSWRKNSLTRTPNQARKIFPMFLHSVSELMDWGPCPTSLNSAELFGKFSLQFLATRDLAYGVFLILDTNNKMTAMFYRETSIRRHVFMRTAFCWIVSVTKYKILTKQSWKILSKNGVVFNFNYASSKEKISNFSRFQIENC